MTEIIVAVIGSGALSALISGGLALLQAQRKKEDAIKAGVRQLLYDRIKYLCKEHISRDYIASNDLEDLIRMHKIYHDDLDGNGFLDDLMDQVRQLRIVPAIVKEEERK